MFFYKITTTAGYGVTRLLVQNTTTLITFNFQVVDQNLQISQGTSLYKFHNSLITICRKVASSNTSRLEAHAGFFRLLMMGIFDPYLQ